MANIKLRKYNYLPDWQDSWKSTNRKWELCRRSPPLEIGTYINFFQPRPHSFLGCKRRNASVMVVNFSFFFVNTERLQLKLCVLIVLTIKVNAVIFILSPRAHLLNYRSRKIKETSNRSGRLSYHLVPMIDRCDVTKLKLKACRDFQFSMANY